MAYGKSMDKPYTSIGKDSRGYVLAVSTTKLMSIFFSNILWGVNSFRKGILDATGEGALVNKTLAKLRNLIETMAANSQQFYACNKP